MFCKKCGTRNLEIAKFCENCGISLYADDTDEKSKGLGVPVSLIVAVALVILVVILIFILIAFIG